MEFSSKLKDWFLDHIRQQKKCVLLLKLLYFILFYVFIFLFGFVNRGSAGYPFLMEPNNFSNFCQSIFVFFLNNRISNIFLQIP